MINIIKEQYYLSRDANIGLLESNLMPDFEREAFLNMVLKDSQKMAES